MNFKSLFEQYLNFVGQLLPKTSKPVIIGIDIGTSSLKAIELVAVTGGWELRNFIIERIDGGEVAAALKKLAGRLQMTKQIPVTSVSGKGTLIRYVDMPRIPIGDLRKSFGYELDKYFPFDPQSIYYDCCILDPKSKDKKMSVLVAAVKKDVVDERLKLFKEAQIDLNHITTNAIATANAFDVLGPAVATGNHGKAILDIGGSVSTLMILKDRCPSFTRDIFVGSNDMTKQIANALGIDQSQAESLKCAPGDQMNKIIEACEAPLNQLIGEVRLSLDYFVTEKNVQVDELFLVGGGSLLKGIEVNFEKHLGVAVKIWNPLAGVRLSPEVANSDVHLYSSQLGVALGLGLMSV